MSWSLQTKPRPAPAIFRAIDETQPTHELSEESIEQVRAAKAAAKSVIETQAVGGSDKAFGVSLSGHANEGHEPAEGYARDFIQITVTQADAEEED